MSKELDLEITTKVHISAALIAKRKFFKNKPLNAKIVKKNLKGQYTDTYSVLDYLMIMKAYGPMHMKKARKLWPFLHNKFLQLIIL